MIDRIDRIIKHPKVVYRDLGEGEGGVLLHLESGQYHGVNRTGALIWKLLDGQRSLEEIFAQASTLLPDAPAQLHADIAIFLQGLRERNLIQVQQDKTEPTPAPAS